MHLIHLIHLRCKGVKMQRCEKADFTTFARCTCGPLQCKGECNVMEWIKRYGKGLIRTATKLGAVPLSPGRLHFSKISPPHRVICTLSEAGWSKFPTE